MDRRTFVGLGALGFSGVLAGCLNGENGDDDDDTGPENSNYRSVQIRLDDISRRADSLVIQGGEAFVTLRVENIGDEPLTIDISLQMRGTDGNPFGAPYSRSELVIAPGETASIRFDLDQDPQEIAGYELIVTESDS